MSPMDPRRGGDEKIAYLTKRFPRLSETFILDEILGLESRGVPISLYAIAHPGEATVQEDVSKVKSPVGYIYLPEDEGGRICRLSALVLGNLAVFLRYPGRYVSVAMYIVRKRRSRSAVKHFIEAGRFTYLMGKENTIHIHAAFAHGPASVAHFAHLLSGVPFSFASHAKDIYLSAPDLLARKAAASSFVLVCSKAAESELRKRFDSHLRPEVRLAAADKSVLAYHGVDVERFRPLPGKTRGYPLRILSVGRLVPKKGFVYLIEALAMMPPSLRKEFRLEIIGGGPLREELTRGVALAGLEQVVVFKGSLTHQEIAEEFRNADIYVQPSVVLENGDRDGIPNALMEAMASSLAIVGTTVSGIPEVIDHGFTGLLIPPENSKALAEALARLVEHDELRTCLGARARVYAEQHLSRRVCATSLAERFLKLVPEDRIAEQRDSGFSVVEGEETRR